MRPSIPLAALVPLASLVLGSVGAAAASAEPTTQACLGDLDRFLSCPDGAARVDTECRDNDDGYWLRVRHGPAVAMRFRSASDPSPPIVYSAASYKDDQKTGRVYRFDAAGKLAAWDDMLGDQHHGASVVCTPDGHITSITYFSHNHRVGVSRWWSARGDLVRASEHDGHGHSVRADPTPATVHRPDELCQPRRCDVTTQPDLSGVPARLR
jgi:hypothetical protein